MAEHAVQQPANSQKSAAGRIERLGYDTASMSAPRSEQSDVSTVSVPNSVTGFLPIRFGEIPYASITAQHSFADAAKADEIKSAITLLDDISRIAWLMMPIQLDCESMVVPQIRWIKTRLRST